MGKEYGARLSRRLWGGSNTSPLITTAWEASHKEVVLYLSLVFFRKKIIPIPTPLVLLFFKF